MRSFVISGFAAIVLVLASLPPDWRMDNDAAVRWLLFIIALGIWRGVDEAYEARRAALGENR